MGRSTTRGTSRTLRTMAGSRTSGMGMSITGPSNTRPATTVVWDSRITSIPRRTGTTATHRRRRSIEIKTGEGSPVLIFPEVMVARASLPASSIP
jgi:hypothetical protein